MRLVPCYLHHSLNRPNSEHSGHNRCLQKHQDHFQPQDYCNGRRKFVSKYNKPDLLGSERRRSECVASYWVSSLNVLHTPLRANEHLLHAATVVPLQKIHGQKCNNFRRKIGRNEIIHEIQSTIRLAVLDNSCTYSLVQPFLWRIPILRPPSFSVQTQPRRMSRATMGRHDHSHHSKLHLHELRHWLHSSANLHEAYPLYYLRELHPQYDKFKHDDKPRSRLHFSHNHVHFRPCLCWSILRATGQQQDNHLRKTCAHNQAWRPSDIHFPVVNIPSHHWDDSPLHRLKLQHQEKVSWQTDSEKIVWHAQSGPSDQTDKCLRG